MIIPIIAWVISLFYILNKGNLIKGGGPGFLDIDLVTIFMCYLLVRHGNTAAVVFAFVQGILIDVFSAGLLGMSALLYLIAFFCVYFGCRLLDLLSPRGQVILVASAVFLRRIVFVLILEAFSLKVTLSFSSITLFAISAIATGIVAVPVFVVFDRLERTPARRV
ncbi:MAG: rod shape-determining protein MreD [Deltaproteobacteria bacterium]|nr:MAG: rod shape-determining protein MreD [Deltaproteobacteria bacterium]